MPFSDFFMIKILHLHTIKNKLGFSAHLNQKNVFYLNFIIRTKATFFIPCLEWYNDTSELIFSLNTDPKWKGIHWQHN